ncbi:MAG: Ig-like domain-containing protein [Candidatus Thorarchaeota archaeon]
MSKTYVTVLIVFLFLGPLLISPEIVMVADQNVIYNPIEHEGSGIVTSAANVADDSLNVLKRNWDFEESDDFGGPQGWDYYHTTWSRSNDTYQDFVANGSYSGRIQAQGSEFSDSYANLLQYPGGLSANIDESLELEFWWYTVAIPDISVGSSCFFSVEFYNGSYYYIVYYLAAGNSFGSNSSITTRYLLNESMLQWNHFNQNLFDDFNARPGWSASGNLYITQLQFQVYSQTNSGGISEAIIDDVSVTNATAYDYLQSRNGNFETGDGGYWGSSGQTDESYVSLSSDSIHGAKALNLTASSTVDGSYSSAWIHQDLGNPLGITPYAPDILLFDFDWKYQDTFNGLSQSSYLSIYFSNDTYWSSVSYYFGNNMNASIGGNYSQPTYSYYYLEAPGFGSRGEWNHFHIDLYDFVNEIGFTDIGVYSYELYTYTQGYSNATAEILIDSLRVICYPTGDPGFEMEADGRSTTYEIPGWNNFGTQSNFNHTHDSHSGNWAANITPAAGESARLTRDLRYQLDSGGCIDFWWRLDEFTSSINGFAYVEVTFEGYYYAYYYLALDSGLSLTNQSNEVYYIVPEVNTTSTWIHTVRYLASDAEAGFGANSWNVTSIQLWVYSDGTGKTSILFDDVTITDSVSPTGIPVVVTPVYHSPTTVNINADDNRAGVEEVLVYYNSGSGWLSVPASYQFSHWTATIPTLPWGTSVDYFATIADYAGHLTVSDNGGNDYNFIVGDDINPSVTLDTPSDASMIVDSTFINASASDIGSGIERVEYLIDSTSVYNDTTSPYSFMWDSRSVSNGTHTISVVAFDNEGLMSEDSVLVNVQNDVHSPLVYSLMLNPSQPDYGEDTTVSVTVLDVSNIKNVTLFYAVEPYTAPPSLILSQAWISLEMGNNGPVYTGVIPAQDYWNTVLYYVVAYDIYDQATYIGSDAEPLEYNVGDTDNPSLSLNGPTEGAIVKGLVTFSISGYDAGSGIEQVRFYVDGSFVTTEDGVNDTVSWDTTQVENGEHTIAFEAEDYAGNVLRIEIMYEVANPDLIGAIAESFSTIMSSYGFFIGAGTVILGFLLAKFIMNRRAAGKPAQRKKK